MDTEFVKMMRILASKPRSPHKKYCLKYTKQNVADALGIHVNSLYYYCKKNNIILKSLSLLELVNLINSLSTISCQEEIELSKAKLLKQEQ